MNFLSNISVLPTILKAEYSVANKPTIIDIALLAGVSTATVSRTLNNPDVVSKNTRSAVMDAVKSTGYTLNTAAQNLRRNKADAVLVLVPDISNTFFSEVLFGIDQVASKAGLTILIGNTAKLKEREETFWGYLDSGRTDGVLVLTGQLPDNIERRIIENPQEIFPIVSVSEELSSQVVPHVGIDNAAAAQMATNHLLELGHKRIAHLCGPKDNILTRQRIKGYRKAMLEAGIREDMQILLDGDFTAASGEKAANILLAMDPPPTAVFCSSDEMAIGLISALYELGVHIPKDISIAGFDDINFSRNYIPALTTIHQPRRRIGEKAMEVLLSCLESKNRDTADPIQQNFYTRYDAELIIRNSTAKVSNNP